MSCDSASVRAIAFGDLEAGVWGAGWWGQESFAAVGLIGSEPLTLSAATLDGDSPAEDWRVAGAGVELVLGPAGNAVPALAGDDQHGDFDQACRANGVVTLGGTELAVACLGRRSARRLPFDPKHFECLREVSAWCTPGQGVVVSSLRPRGARGHAADVITAALIEQGAAPRVVDPRLSTTYTAAGEPTRMTLELWLESDGDTEHYPRRIAGEAIGSRALASRGSLEFRAELLRCHSRGRDGAGVYLLIRSR